MDEFVGNKSKMKREAQDKGNMETSKSPRLSDDPSPGPSNMFTVPVGYVEGKEGSVNDNEVFLSQEKKVDKDSCCSFHHGNQDCSPLPHMDFESLERPQKTALVWASGDPPKKNIKSVCNFHFNQLLGDVLPLPEDLLSKQCCITDHITKSLRKVTLLFALKARKRGFLSVRSEQLICDVCRKVVMDTAERIPGVAKETDTLIVSPEANDPASGSSETMRLKENVDLQACGPSPVLHVYRSSQSKAAEDSSPGPSNMFTISVGDLEGKEGSDHDNEVVYLSQEKKVDQDSCCSFQHGNQDCSPLPHLDFESLPKLQKVALVWASGDWEKKTISSICNLHFDLLLGDILPLPEDFLNKRCCISDHITKTLRKVTPLFALKARERGFSSVRSEQLICDVCRKVVMDTAVQIIPAVAKETETLILTPEENNPASGSSETMELKDNFDLQALGLSPVINVYRSTRSKAGRIKEAKKKLIAHTAKLVTKLCAIFDVSPEEIQNEYLSQDYEKLLSEVREKLVGMNSRSKVRLLTLCPDSWSVNYAQKYFGVSRYLICKAKSLKQEKGILAEKEPSLRPKSKLSDEVKEVVKSYFELDENSRALPGMKDRVSISKNVYMPKRLLLFNLSEVHENFKKDFPSVKIGFSSFCLLRPKWVVLAGSSGTHSVCVCKIHQNLKFLLHALPFENKCKDIINEIVCNEERRECQLRICKNCPTKNGIVDLLIKKSVASMGLDPSDPDYEDTFQAFFREQVEYKEWTSTDRPDIVTQSCSLENLIVKAAEALDKAIPHEFISKHQAAYLKNLKENLPLDTAIVIMDFSMNYTCTVQDAIQSEHWTKRQVTLHPVVIYFRDINGDLKHKSLCFMSNDLDHDNGMVLLTQKQVIAYLKSNVPHVKLIEYFTDGCAKQYKNCQAFLNLCRHEDLFGMRANWNFFATSHGKSSCDGIGGIVKREARRASIQRIHSGQIIDANTLFQFCEKNLSDKVGKEIYFEFLTKAAADAMRMQIKLFGIKPTTVPGTRSFHRFEPLTGFTIGCKRFSADEMYSLTHRLSTKRYLNELQMGSYHLVTVDGKHYLGMVTGTDDEEEEADVMLLHPSMPTEVFEFPDDMASLLVPYPHLLANLEVIEGLDNTVLLALESSKVVKILISA